MCIQSRVTASVTLYYLLIAPYFSSVVYLAVKLPVCGGCLSFSSAPQLLNRLNLTDASGSCSLSSRQKYAHVRQSQRGSKPYYTSAMWWCGVVLMGIGELGNFAAYGFAPASLIAPLGCVSVIGKCDLFSPHTLSMHEGRRKGCFLWEPQEALPCEVCSVFF